MYRLLLDVSEGPELPRYDIVFWVVVAAIILGLIACVVTIVVTIIKRKKKSSSTKEVETPKTEEQ